LDGVADQFAREEAEREPEPCLDLLLEERIDGATGE
jgi:hypothetical protein